MAAKWRVVCVLDFSFLFSLIEEFIYFGELINHYIEKLSFIYLFFGAVWWGLVAFLDVLYFGAFLGRDGMNLSRKQSCPHNNHPLFNLNIISTILNFFIFL